MKVHSQARTTPRISAEISASTDSLSVLAERYDIARVTARKWKRRDNPQDRSHRSQWPRHPHTLYTTRQDSSPAEE